MLPIKIKYYKNTRTGSAWLGFSRILRWWYSIAVPHLMMMVFFRNSNVKIFFMNVMFIFTFQSQIAVFNSLLSYIFVFLIRMPGTNYHGRRIRLMSFRSGISVMGYYSVKIVGVSVAVCHAFALFYKYVPEVGISMCVLILTSAELVSVFYFWGTVQIIFRIPTCSGLSKDYYTHLSFRASVGITFECHVSFLYTYSITTNTVLM